MIYVIELDVTFYTGLNEPPALIGNEGARETAMIEIKKLKWRMEKNRTLCLRKAERSLSN